MMIVQKDKVIGKEMPIGELPEGWESTSLKTLATLRKGKKPNRLDTYAWLGAIPYIDIEAFERGNIRRYADPESSALVDEGDIIVVWDGARCGHVGKAPKNGGSWFNLRSNPTYISSSRLYSAFSPIIVRYHQHKSSGYWYTSRRTRFILES